VPNPYPVNRIITKKLSFQICWRERLHHTRPLGEARPEDPIRILKHAVLQTHHDELTSLKARLD
jgi:hypothetical protein